jgi:hypothetical protein
MTKVVKWGFIAVGALGVAAFLLFPKRVRAGNRVLLLGDSLTGSPGYCGTVKQRLKNAEVRCASFPGEGVRFIHGEAMKLVSSFKPTTVVVLAGVNDIGSSRGLEYTKKALDALYNDLAGHGIRVVAVTLTPWADHYIGSASRMQTETLQLNAWIRKHPIPVAVVETGGLTGQGKDGLHLTRAGGEMLAGLILTRLT